ncbi:hypothetical protein TUM4636_22980 [Shewanella glacialipiscicola]|uniref:Uncharacterized protein n=1 Tax=Shewanella glacialipiscicola TaxID=614069 RepID=A0ABQ6J594_9GAMM|nr:hypothetical protein TUM4636_22980 [Shewanella glacialipiscicola]GMA82638.1 hypothetical protein GCM10025855_21710 [Shewanella glacialipiscicola]
MRTRYQHTSGQLNTELKHPTQGNNIKVNFNHLRALLIQELHQYYECFLGKAMLYGNKKAAISCRFFAQYSLVKT